MSNSTYLHWRRWALLCGSLVLVAGVAIASFNSLLRAEDAAPPVELSYDLDDQVVVPTPVAVESAQVDRSVSSKLRPTSHPPMRSDLVALERTPVLATTDVPILHAQTPGTRSAELLITQKVAVQVLR